MSFKNSLQRRSLQHQIEAVKAELIENKQTIAEQSDLLTRKIHSQLTDPATLFFAGFTGFMLAEFNHRPVQNDAVESANKIRSQFNKHQEVTDRALKDERSASAECLGKPISEQWSFANINQLLNSSVHILTLINSSIVSLEEIMQPKPHNSENIKSEESQGQQTCASDINITNTNKAKSTCPEVKL